MTMLAGSYPLGGEKSEIQFTSSTAPWGFWATLGWLGLAIIAFFAAALFTGFCYGFAWAIANPGLAFDPTSPVLAHLTTVVAVPAAAVTLVFAARRAGMPLSDYLGLRIPKMLHILASIGALVIFALLCFVITRLFPTVDQSNVTTSGIHTTTVSPGAIALFWIMILVTAPIAEEIAFRGFAFRGWSETRLGNGGAIALSSMVFAIIHVQYSISGMAVVFGLGLMLGMIRWLSGSTLLTILIHSMWNLYVGAAIALAA